MDALPDKIAALRIERKALADLKPHPRNPRLHAEPGTAKWQALEKSLLADYFDPMVWNERNGMLVSGHFRHKVLTHNGYTAADVSVVDYDEETHLARLIAANQLLGDWEEELLATLASELTSAGIHAGLAGLTDKEIATLAGAPVVIDDTERAVELATKAEELDQRWRVRPGELFAIGRHRLLCGDSRGPGCWRRLLDGGQADMVWTDPPYNVAYEGGAGDMPNDDMDPEAYFDLLREMFSMALSVTKPGGAIYVAHADSEGLSVRRAFEEAGWFQSQTLIWAKSQFTLSRSDYQWQHEPILYGWKPGAGHYWQGGYCQASVADLTGPLDELPKAQLLELVKSLRDAFDTTVVREPKPSLNELHPTVKPLRLVARHLWNSSRAGETVIDLCGGSGTTLMAAEQTGRRCAITELTPRYCAVILERAKEAGLPIEKLPDANAA